MSYHHHSIEPLPCPFCGKSDSVRVVGSLVVCCNANLGGCGASMHTGLRADGDPAVIEAWNRRAPAPVSDKGEGPRRCPSCGATNIVLSSGWWVCRPCGARWEATPPCDAGARCDQAEFFQCHLPKGHDGFCRAPLGSILGGGEDDGRVWKCNRCDGDGLVECGECGGSGFYNSDHPPPQPPADAALSEVRAVVREIDDAMALGNAEQATALLAAFAEKQYQQGYQDGYDQGEKDEREACAKLVGWGKSVDEVRTAILTRAGSWK